MKQTLMGLLGGLLFWTGWVEFLFGYFAWRFGVHYDLVGSGIVQTTTEYVNGIGVSHDMLINGVNIQDMTAAELKALRTKLDVMMSMMKNWGKVTSRRGLLPEFFVNLLKLFPQADVVSVLGPGEGSSRLELIDYRLRGGGDGAPEIGAAAEQQVDLVLEELDGDLDADGGPGQGRRVGDLPVLVGPELDLARVDAVAQREDVGLLRAGIGRRRGRGGG